MDFKRSRPALWLVLVVLLSSLIGSAVGKYVETVRFADKVTFTAKLADNLVLLEHEAVRQPNGEYTLDKDKTVTENYYHLLPGLDIPKDPYVQVTGKTDIPAFLYVEVVKELTDEALMYTIDPKHWLLLEGFGGKNGGMVYVFTVDTHNPAEIGEEFNSNPVNILTNDILVVRQNLKHSTAADKLKFYACMGETTSSDAVDLTEKAKEVYKTVNNMT